MANWLNNRLSQVVSPSLSSMSAANKLRLSSRGGSLNTNVDDLETTLDASEVYDTTDVGRLTSPLISQEREVSATLFGVSCSQTDSSVERSRRDVEPLSSFGEPLSKGKRKSRFGECTGFSSGEGKKSVRTKRHSRLP